MSKKMMVRKNTDIVDIQEAVDQETRGKETRRCELVSDLQLLKQDVGGSTRQTEGDKSCVGVTTRRDCLVNHIEHYD